MITVETLLGLVSFGALMFQIGYALGKEAERKNDAKNNRPSQGHGYLK